MRAIQIIVLLLSLLIISCDKGLSPNAEIEKAGFGGTIKFFGEWNPEIKQTNLVIFKNPLLSVTDFNIFNLKFVSETIPFGSQTFQYSTNNENSILSTIDADQFSYIAVAQSIRDTLSLSREDWLIVGLYYSYNDSTKPGTIIIPEATFVDSININCDLDNPPIQPPGGEINLMIIDSIIEYSKISGRDN